MMHRLCKAASVVGHDDMSMRKHEHAGSWYSNDKSILQTELEEWMKEAREIESTPPNILSDDTWIRAIIAPHAGLS